MAVQKTQEVGLSAQKKHCFRKTIALEKQLGKNKYNILDK